MAKKLKRNGKKKKGKKLKLNASNAADNNSKALSNGLAITHCAGSSTLNKSGVTDSLPWA